MTTFLIMTANNFKDLEFVTLFVELIIYKLSAKARYLKSKSIIIILRHLTIYGGTRGYIYEAFSAGDVGSERSCVCNMAQSRQLSISCLFCSVPSNLINYLIKSHSRLWMQNQLLTSDKTSNEEKLKAET